MVVCDTTVLHYRQVVVVSCVESNFNDSFISWCCVVFYFSICCFVYIFRDDFGGNAKLVAILIILLTISTYVGLHIRKYDDIPLPILIH